MKKTSFLLAAFVTLFWMSGCSPIYKVYSEEEPGVNLSTYHTYQWLGKREVDGAEQYIQLSQKTEDKIRTSVQAQLARYDFQPCDYAPDLMLHYHVVIKNEIFFYHDWQCDEETWQTQGRCHRVKAVNFQEGTLILDFIDAHTGNQVWRGVAIAALENMTEQEVNQRIEEAVRRIFEKFPEKPLPGIANQ